MKYRRIGDFIEQVKVKNQEGKYGNLLGINIDKYFMPSVANIIGVNLKRYKVVKYNQFACNRMHVGRDYRIPMALSQSQEPFIVSPAYTVFGIIDESILLPDYLMMWFCRPEFDRECWFHTDADVRGGLPWELFCDIEIPIPSIEKQQEIVNEYNTITNRITLNEQLNKKLEETAQAIYKHWFVEEKEKGWEIIKLSEVCNLITDGKHGDCQNELNSGYYFVSVKDLSNSNIVYDEARQITKEDFEETHRRTNLEAGDILLTNAGTIGRLAIVKNSNKTRRTTFQKSVAILKPNNDVIKSYYLYLLLKTNIRVIKELAGGSTQSNLLLGDLRNFEFVFPGTKRINDFDITITPIFKKIEITGKEILVLKKMKELLLSKMTKVEIEKEV